MMNLEVAQAAWDAYLTLVERPRPSPSPSQSRPQPRAAARAYIGELVYLTWLMLTRFMIET